MKDHRGDYCAGSPQPFHESSVQEPPLAFRRQNADSDTHFGVQEVSSTNCVRSLKKAQLDSLGSPQPLQFIATDGESGN